MKRTFITFSVILSVGFSALFANGPVTNNPGFVSSDEEVAMDVQRGTGEVKLHLVVKNMTRYDHILIERSSETPDYFGKCKYISCEDTKSEKGDFMQIDKYPYAADKDVYYRVKTVTKDGIERAYPAVLLASARQ